LAPYTVIYGYTNPIPNLTLPVNEQNKRYLSYYGNMGYTYNNKYSATASVRFDDATLFGVDRNKRARPFWSAGLKWNAKQEDFMQNMNWLSQLDLRATYGTGGAIPLGGNSVTVLTAGANDPYTQQQVLTILRAANQNLGWETTTTLNTGIDLAVFKDALSLNFDIYSKKSNGILWELPYNATYGISTLQFNTGTMKSHGVELGITGRPLTTKDWGITSTFNFSYSANKVTDNRFSNNVYSNVIGSTVPLNDHALGSLFVYKFAGLDPATGQSQIYDRNNNVIKSSVNLPSTFTTEDLKFAGLRTAPYYGGFYNKFRYKQFEAGVQISYYLGHVFLRNSVTTANYPSTSRAYTGQLGRNEDIADRWRKTGDEAFTNVPGITGVSANSINRYRYSDVLVESADNIRLQQISLSYNVPSAFLPKNAFKSLTLSANVRNVGLIWTRNKEGIDPEYINTTSYSNLPPTPNFIFSLNASF
jgi:outer membrane receptor protein involved in Fe transport